MLGSLCEDHNFTAALCEAGSVRKYEDNGDGAIAQALVSYKVALKNVFKLGLIGE